ncbi:MAG: RNA methyltransferase [Lachnospiraceae bacterium]|nr:RNA methyltransferase [Lachnospiraceae bacterium]
MITSTSNARVKQLMQLQKKAKTRNEQDVFVVEGIKMFREIPPGRLVQTFVSEHFYQENKSIITNGSPVTVLSDHVFESVSDTRTPQGVLALVRQYHYELEDLLGKGVHPLILALENLQDPGNLGTIFRMAEGAGVTGILLSPGCADIYNPKVIRSTMGSVYRMPFYYAQGRVRKLAAYAARAPRGRVGDKSPYSITDDLRRDILAFREKGVCWHAAHLEGSVPYDEADYRGPCGILIGNESKGLTAETAALADRRVRIPMCGQVESLNAAVAASVLAYEANRQRRNAAGTRMEKLRRQ